MRTKASGHTVEMRSVPVSVRVSRDGVVLAETTRPVILEETELPARYYIPAEDVRMELLTPTATTTRCPYKGEATYWSVMVGDNVIPDFVWTYAEPIPEAMPIAGLLCFYNEKVDLDVDGARISRPTTRWS